MLLMLRVMSLQRNKCTRKRLFGGRRGNRYGKSTDSPWLRKKSTSRPNRLATVDVGGPVGVCRPNHSLTGTIALRAWCVRGYFRVSR